MSRPWTETIFEFEASNGTLYQVSLELGATGSYAEPELDFDGPPLLRSLDSDEWRPIDSVGLQLRDIERLRETINAEVDALLEAHFEDVALSLAESAADAGYENERDSRDE